jgi:hypothetical protein
VQRDHLLLARTRRLLGDVMIPDLCRECGKPLASWNNTGFDQRSVKCRRAYQREWSKRRPPKKRCRKGKAVQNAKEGPLEAQG